MGPGGCGAGVGWGRWGKDSKSKGLVKERFPQSGNWRCSSARRARNGYKNPTVFIVRDRPLWPELWSVWKGGFKLTDWTVSTVFVQINFLDLKTMFRLGLCRQSIC